MDKRVIFAVAGAGKTTYIVDSLSLEKRTLIVTYTVSNYENLSQKIADKFGGKWPENVTLMTFFQFLYQFCYKPLLSDQVKARGIVYKQNPNQFAKQDHLSYYCSPRRYFYSNRLSLFLEKANLTDAIKARIEKYFDEFVIDEIQDIAGRDFNFLESIMTANINMLFVGDFYQHTFDTSRDGNVNQSLFVDYGAYEKRFTRKGFISDTTTLTNSWRCGKNICDYIRENLAINIFSNRNDEDEVTITFISDPGQIEEIMNNSAIIKLHYQKSNQFGPDHRNWGDTKGEDKHEDVCVMLNKATAKLHKKAKLRDLAPLTRNKLYVAITRAHGNVYFVYE